MRLLFEKNLQPGPDPGFPVGGVSTRFGAMDHRCGCFLVKIYVKMKELGPVGGGRAPQNFVCRSANASALEIIKYAWSEVL